MSADPILRWLAALALFACNAGTHALPPLEGATAISVGSGHVCAALAPGGAACWGEDGTSGALGRTTPGIAAGLVEGLPVHVDDLALGSAHSCTLDADGRVRCWGDNQSGQLGIGPTPLFATRTPTLVALPGAAAHIAARSRHTCAVVAGGAWCWGANVSGEVGDGTQWQRSQPVPVAGMASDVEGIAAGGNYSPNFSCAIRTGALWCWGANDLGQLGNGSMSPSLVPVPVPHLATGVAQVSAGSRHACAVVAGAVHCWGYNAQGQLGDGTLATRLEPVAVVNVGGSVASISAGGGHTCAVRLDGVVVCWGSNEVGQLGDGTTISRTIAAPVAGLAGPALAVGTGEESTCVLLATGRVQCFGRTTLGIGARNARSIPVEVAGVTNGWAAFDGGERFTCGMTGTASAACFGQGERGQIGNGDRASAWQPTPVATLATGVAGISAGRDHACAHTQQGGAWCWGSGDAGKLGNGGFVDALVPAAVVGLQSGVTQVVAGGWFSCAVADGSARCWGSNAAGSLGIGTVGGEFSVPVGVVGLDQGVAFLAAGEYHACAIRNGGGLKCWGSNGSGELGDGTTFDRPVPVDVLGLNVGVIDAALGRGFTCAVTSAGAVFCWGQNASGQLGDGTQSSKRVPAPVIGLSGGVVRVVAGEEHACALLTGGEVRCWGANLHGQAGPNALQAWSTPPVSVPLGEPAYAIAAGGMHTCALLGGGRGRCWGRSQDAQLGNGDAVSSAEPRFVVVGDFASAIALSVAPSPSANAEYVTITARVSAAEEVPVGEVSFTEGAAPLACSGTARPTLEFGVARCVVPLFTGVYDLTATFVPGTASLLPSSATIRHAVGAVAGQHCAGFDDVDAANAFCTSVAWMRNRGITQGCAAFAYCPAMSVNRLSMAAFMDRLGGVLGPRLADGATTYPQLYPTTSACIVTIAREAYPRIAFVDVVVSARADATDTLEFQTVGRGMPTFAGPPAEFVAIGAPVRIAGDGVRPFAVRLSARCPPVPNWTPKWASAIRARLTPRWKMSAASCVRSSLVPPSRTRRSTLPEEVDHEVA